MYCLRAKENVLNAESVICLHCPFQNCGKFYKSKKSFNEHLRLYPEHKPGGLPTSWKRVSLAGPITPESKDGHKYAMVFVDDYSVALGVYFLKNKSDAVRATEQFLADTAQYGTVKRLPSHNGGEYISEEFKSLPLKNHIKHEFSAPYSPHLNGTAERAWRSLFDTARYQLMQNYPSSYGHMLS